MDFSHLPTYIELAGAAIVGGLAVFGLFNTTMRGRRSEDSSVATNLINNLQTSLNLTESNLKATNVKLEQTTKELHQMQGRNQVLEALFNGQEGSIMAFLKQAPVLVRIAEENNAMAKQNTKDISDLTSSIKLLVGAMQPGSGSSVTVNTAPALKTA